MQKPVFDQVSIEDLMEDPYPAFKKMHEIAPVVWVPCAHLNLVTDYETIMEIERHPELFTSSNPASLMNTVMGHSLMRKDGTQHMLERKALEATFRPGTVKNHWAPLFRKVCTELIDELLEKDNSAEMFNDFAAPMASRCLLEIIGIKDMSWQELAIHSQALMDAVGNYGNDPEIQARGKAASKAIDIAIDAVIKDCGKNPDPCAISAMLHCQEPLTLEQIRANVKVIAGGGLNEPRDAILTALYGLLANPDQKQAVMGNPKLYSAAFEEAVRWLSPIGMYPRRVASDTVLGGVELKQGDQLGICVGAANRDSIRVEHPAEYDIFRKRAPHLGFGAGPHFCAGTWVARMMVGSIAVPELLTRIPTMALSETDPVILRGWVFRGPVHVPVVW